MPGGLSGCNKGCYCYNRVVRVVMVTTGLSGLQLTTGLSWLQQGCQGYNRVVMVTTGLLWLQQGSQGYNL